jgi:polar amino acid transport system substrate-binding protein
MRTIFACLFILLSAAVALAQTVTPEQKAELAPTGTLRAAVVMIPFLAKQSADGQLSGVAADLGVEMARALGVPYEAQAIKAPPDGVAAVRDGKADITFLAPTPERNRILDFAPAFMEMELTLLVMAGSPIQTLADADQPGRRIVVYERSANEEMVRQKLGKATRLLVPLSDHKKAFEMIKSGEADAFADLLYQITFARLPSAEERTTLEEFLSLQHDRLTREARRRDELALPVPCPENDDPYASALVDACLALLNSSEFIYID